ncbi:MAG TPA: hypothetical protein VKE26_26280 [Xanthobacteraceae bacterium]|nr:hypothetical protein [Xanthobacteraceae bacterium]
MTNEQLFLAVALPLITNTVLVLFVSRTLVQRSEALEQRMLQGFAALNTRFDDMRDLWRAELHRVEGILDARLKQLEERSR